MASTRGVGSGAAARARIHRGSGPAGAVSAFPARPAGFGGGTSPCCYLAAVAWIIQIPAGMAAARAREMEVFDQIWVKTCYWLLPRPAMATLSASFPS